MGHAVIQLVDSQNRLLGDLEERVLVIGRSPAADIQVDDPTVSRLHAAAWVQDGVVFLKDLGGANGTFINGERLHGTITLPAGARVTLGRDTRIELQIGGDPLPIGRPVEATMPDGSNNPYPQLVKIGQDGGRVMVMFRSSVNGREALVKGTRGAKLLSELATALANDIESGKPIDAQGWRSDESLSNVIWKGAPRSRNNLNVLLHRVRKTLLEGGVDPGCIQKESGMCRLWVERIELG